ncbi:MAG TPA: hypothetical protein VMB03_03375 [Bryobacteraceae bacterium]|nr:hypothetical protein [Bryobacteraceae bacterium]
MARPQNKNGVTYPAVAYISGGQLYLQHEDGERIVESPFGRSLRDRAGEIYRRNAWKVQGRGGQSLARALRMPAESDPSAFRVAITSVARGSAPGELMYTLETDEISGVFVREADGTEKRLFHTADFRASHLDRRPGGCELALSIQHGRGLADLAVMKGDGSGLTEVTEGESLDEAPRWVPGERRRLVYQSAGIARDRRGVPVGNGPYTIQEIDLESREVACLAQDPELDFVQPRAGGDGMLYYIRKPRLKPQLPKAGPGFFRMFAFILMLRLMRSGQNPDGVTPPEKQFQPPSSWQLMRQERTAGAQAEVLARGVASFDLAEDGAILYSNGADVFSMPRDGAGAKKVLSGVNIDWITTL